MKRVYIKRGLLSVLLTAFLFAAVIFSSHSINSPESSNEPVTLTWYVNFSWFKGTWGHNLVSRTITERTGVNVRFISPVADDGYKLETMIKSDNMSDLITIDQTDQICDQMVQNHQVFSLTDLADEYYHDFYDAADPDALEWYRRSDGRVYWYPNCSISPKDIRDNDNVASNETFLVRKDIYEAIGSPDMSTPEGFIQAVEAAAEYCPYVENGEPLIPVGTDEFNEYGCDSLDKYLQDFLAVPFEKKGQYYDRNTSSEYLRWLKVFRMLQHKGYISQENYVNSRTQISENFENGRYFCIFYLRTDFTDQQMTRYLKDPDSIYIAIDGPQNSEGDDPVLPTNSIDGWTVTGVSKNCRHLKEAMKLISFMLSEEGQKLTYLGVEGKTYEDTPDGPRYYPSIAQLYETDKQTFNSRYGADYMYWMFMNTIMSLKWKQPKPEALAQMEEWTYPYSTYMGAYDISIPKNTRVAREYDDIRKLWGQTLPKLLLASSDSEFDQIMDDYRDQRDQLGYKELQAEETRQMNEIKRRQYSIQ